MRHGNPLGDKNKDVRGEGTKFSWQASLIPKFSRGDTPGLPLKGGDKKDRKEREEEKERNGEVASWLSGEDAPASVNKYNRLKYLVQTLQYSM